MKFLTTNQVIVKIKENLETGMEAPLSGLFFKNGDPVPPQTPACNLWHTQIFENPRTRTINGVEVPAPETEIPETGTEIWYLSSTSVDGVSCFRWEGVQLDLVTLKYGLWLNEKDALANAKALMS